MSATVEGVWELACWGRTRDGGALAAFGDARGRLIYTCDGFVAAHLERASLTDPGRRQIYSYSGTWRIDGDTAHHAVGLSNVPEWIGTTLTRTVLVLEVDRLHLETPPVPGRNGALRDILEWIRPAAARHG